jgi:hypothetical protein
MISAPFWDFTQIIMLALKEVSRQSVGPILKGEAVHVRINGKLSVFQSTYFQKKLNFPSNVWSRHVDV